MSYDTEKGRIGHEPVSIVEVDMRTCSLTYGIAPCTASGSGDGKCFNSYATCQDKPNFTPTTRTLRFSNARIDEVQGAGEIPTIPSLVAISLSPTSLTPGQGLGIRSTCTITLSDHPYTMVGIDDYIDDRTYLHADRGSLWSKLVTIFPYYVGNEVRVKTGFLEEDGTYDPSNFRTRTYFIDSIAGPSARGQISIKCKDILRFGDREKATVPTFSNAVLDTNINSSQTSIDITDPNDDVKNAYDGGEEYIRIDDEVMLISGISGSNPDYTLTVTRASIPSAYPGSVLAEAHDSDSTVQHCKFFDQEPVNDIVYYLLNTGAGIDASFLPTAEWQEVIDFGLQSYEFTTLLTEPTGVKELLNEISEHTILMWWDERSAKVPMGSLIKKGDAFGEFTDEDNIIQESVNVNRDDSARVSQVWCGFGHRNPVLELDKQTSFSSYFASVDNDAQEVNEYDQVRIKRIFSRWLPLSKRTVANEITNRMLNFYKDTKNLVSMEINPKDDDAWTGDFVEVATRLIQDPNGSTPTRGYRILEANEINSKGVTKYRYKLQSNGSSFSGGGARYGLIGPNTLGDYSTETESNKNKYCFIAFEDRGDGEPGFPTNEDPYLII